MGKNTGYNQTNQQIDQTLQGNTDRYNQYDSMLKGLFGPAYGQSQNWMGDAYGKFGNMYGAYGDVAGSGFGSEFKSRPFYDNLMQTGGFSPKQKQEYRAQALGPTSGYWNAVKENFDASNRVNPYNTGFGAQQDKIARSGGQAMTQAGIGAENSLSQLIREGQLAGAQGETGIANAINSNRLAGMSGQMGATAGIAGLGGQELNFAHSLIDNMLSNAQLDANTRNQLLGLKAQLNPRRPGFWESAAGMIPGAINTAIGLGGKGGGKNARPEVAGPPADLIASGGYA